MIRMGRSSKTEQPVETSNAQTQTADSPYQSTGGSQSSSRVVSDSESMARDIKEGRLSGFVGSGTVLTGETSFQAMLRIDGHLTGRVMSESGTLIVGTTGRVDANVLVAAAVINGMVNGDIVASEKLELGRTARVVGNVQAPRLVIEDGALIEGNCSMIKAREAIEQRKIEANSRVAQGEASPFETAATATRDSYYESADEETSEAAVS